MNLGSKNRDKPTRPPGEGAVGQWAKVREAAREKRHQAVVKAVGDVADQIRASLEPSLNAIPVTAALAKPILTRASAGFQRMTFANTRLVGWSLANTSTTAATLVRFRTGRGDAGDVVATTIIPAGGTSTMRVGGPGGVFVGDDGLTVEFAPVPGAGAVGALEGSVHVGAVD